MVIEYLLYLNSWLEFGNIHKVLECILKKCWKLIKWVLRIGCRIICIRGKKIPRDIQKDEFSYDENKLPEHPEICKKKIPTDKQLEEFSYDGIELPEHPMGIPNLINKCFMNSFLQVMVWTPLFAKQLSKQLKLGNSKQAEMSRSILKLLYVHYRFPEEHVVDDSIPKCIVEAVRKINSQFMGDNQEDSFEIFNTILSGIEDDGLQIWNVSTDCEFKEKEKIVNNLPVSKLFRGKHVSKWSFTSCSCEEDVTQVFTSLSVPVDHVLKQDQKERRNTQNIVSQSRESAKDRTKPGSEESSEDRTKPGSGEPLEVMPKPESGESLEDKTKPQSRELLVGRAKPGSGQPPEDRTKPESGEHLKEGTKPGSREPLEHRTQPLEEKTKHESGEHLEKKTKHENEESLEDGTKPARKEPLEDMPKSELLKDKTKPQCEDMDEEIVSQEENEEIHSQPTSSEKCPDPNESEILQNDFNNHSEEENCEAESDDKEDNVHKNELINDTAQIKGDGEVNYEREKQLSVEQLNDELKTNVGHGYERTNEVTGVGKYDITDVEKGLFELVKQEEFDEELIGCRKCTNPKPDGKSKKTLKVSDPPPVLVLHINRVEIHYSGQLTKVQQTLTYPSILDLSPFCEDALNGREPIKYSLYGVVNHIGDIHGGHYSAHIKTKNRNTRFLEKLVKGMPSEDYAVDMDNDNDTDPGWYYVSDTFVRNSSEGEALNLEGAYILMYERIKTKK